MWILLSAENENFPHFYFDKRRQKQNTNTQISIKNADRGCLSNSFSLI